VSNEERKRKSTCVAIKKISMKYPMRRKPPVKSFNRPIPG